MLGRCASRPGRALRVGAQTSALRWTGTRSTSSPSSCVVAADGSVYVAGVDPTSQFGEVLAASASGTEKWVYPLPYQGSVGTPAIAADGTIYATGVSAFVAINPDSSMKWQLYVPINSGTGSPIPPSDVSESSPVIGPDGTIYFQGRAPATELYAVSPSGTMKWALQLDAIPPFDAGSQAYITGNCGIAPAIGPDGTIYAAGTVTTSHVSGTTDSSMHAVTPSGTVTWTFTLHNHPVGSPSVGSDGTIYFGTDTLLYAMNTDGTVKWTLPYSNAGFDFTGPAIGADGTIYATDGNCISAFAPPPTSAVRWSFCPPSPAVGAHAPSVGGDGTIYLGTELNGVYALSPDGGVKWHTGASSVRFEQMPAIGGDGTVYVAADKIYAIGP